MLDGAAVQPEGGEHDGRGVGDRQQSLGQFCTIITRDSLYLQGVQARLCFFPRIFINSRASAGLHCVVRFENLLQRYVGEGWVAVDKEKTQYFLNTLYIHAIFMKPTYRVFQIFFNIMFYLLPPVIASN